MSRQSLQSIWITRTHPAASRSAQAWNALGLKPIILPILRVTGLADTPPIKGGLVIFTSKNAVDHFSGQTERVVCVGDATAHHARQAGHKDVISVNGTSKDVTDWIVKNISVDQRVTHVSGRHLRGSIISDLQEAEFSQATRQIVYETAPPPDYMTLWPERDFDYVALYSPRGAQIFKEIATGRDLSQVSFVSISAATDAALDGLEGQARKIAASPSEQAMLALL